MEDQYALTTPKPQPTGMLADAPPSYRSPQRNLQLQDVSVNLDSPEPNESPFRIKKGIIPVTPDYSISIQQTNVGNQQSFTMHASGRNSNRELEKASKIEINIKSTKQRNKNGSGKASSLEQYSDLATPELAFTLQHKQLKEKIDMSQFRIEGVMGQNITIKGLPIAAQEINERKKQALRALVKRPSPVKKKPIQEPIDKWSNINKNSDLDSEKGIVPSMNYSKVQSVIKKRQKVTNSPLYQKRVMPIVDEKGLSVMQPIQAARVFQDNDKGDESPFAFTLKQKEIYSSQKNHSALNEDIMQSSDKDHESEDDDNETGFQQSDEHYHDYDLLRSTDEHRHSSKFGHNTIEPQTLEHDVTETGGQVLTTQNQQPMSISMSHKVSSDIDNETFAAAPHIYQGTKGSMTPASEQASEYYAGQQTSQVYDVNALVRAASNQQPLVKWDSLSDESKTELLQTLQYVEQMCPGGRLLEGASINNLFSALTHLGQVEGMPGFAHLKQAWHKNHAFMPYVANQSARLKKVSQMSAFKRKQSHESNGNSSVALDKFNQTIQNAQKKMNVSPQNWMPTGQMDNNNIVPPSFKISLQHRALSNIPKKEVKGAKFAQQVFDGDLHVQQKGSGNYKLVIRRKSVSPADPTNKNLNSKVSFKTLHKVGEETKWTKKFQQGAFSISKARINQIIPQQLQNTQSLEYGEDENILVGEQIDLSKANLPTFNSGNGLNKEGQQSETRTHLDMVRDQHLANLVLLKNSNSAKSDDDNNVASKSFALQVMNINGATDSGKVQIYQTMQAEAPHDQRDKTYETQSPGMDDKQSSPVIPMLDLEGLTPAKMSSIEAILEEQQDKEITSSPFVKNKKPALKFNTGDNNSLMFPSQSPLSHSYQQRPTPEAEKVVPKPAETNHPTTTEGTPKNQHKKHAIQANILPIMEDKNMSNLILSQNTRNSYSLMTNKKPDYQKVYKTDVKTPRASQKLNNDQVDIISKKTSGMKRQSRNFHNQSSQHNSFAKTARVSQSPPKKNNDLDVILTKEHKKDTVVDQRSSKMNMSQELRKTVNVSQQMAFTNALHQGKSTMSSKIELDAQASQGSGGTAPRASEMDLSNQLSMMKSKIPMIEIKRPFDSIEGKEFMRAGKNSSFNIEENYSPREAVKQISLINFENANQKSAKNTIGSPSDLRFKQRQPSLGFGKTFLSRKQTLKAQKQFLDHQNWNQTHANYWQSRNKRLEKFYEPKNYQRFRRQFPKVKPNSNDEFAAQQIKQMITNPERWGLMRPKNNSQIRQNLNNHSPDSTQDDLTQAPKTFTQRHRSVQNTNTLPNVNIQSDYFQDFQAPVQTEMFDKHSYAETFRLPFNVGMGDTFNVEKSSGIQASGFGDTFNVEKKKMNVTGIPKIQGTNNKQYENSTHGASSRYQSPQLEEDQLMMPEINWPQVNQEFKEMDCLESGSLSAEEDINRRQKFYEALMLPELRSQKDSNVDVVDYQNSNPLIKKSPRLPNQDSETVIINNELKKLKNLHLKEKLHLSRLVENNKQFHKTTTQPKKSKPRAQILNYKQQRLFDKQNLSEATKIRTSEFERQFGTLTQDSYGFRNNIQHFQTMAHTPVQQSGPDIPAMMNNQLGLTVRPKFDVEKMGQTVRFRDAQEKPTFLRQLSNQRGEVVGYTQKKQVKMFPEIEGDNTGSAINPFPQKLNKISKERNFAQTDTKGVFTIEH